MTKTPNIIIRNALADTVRHVNDGDHPTEALRKTAKHYDLNPDYIQRVGESVNVALTYNHFKTADDRSTDFPIARTTDVIADIFGEEEKSDLRKKAEHFPNSEYGNNKVNYRKVLTNKATGIQISKIGTVKEPEREMSYKGMWKKAHDYFDKLDRTVGNLKVAQIQKRDEMSSNMIGLVDHFRKKASTYRTNFDEFESQVFSKYGEHVLPFVDLIYKQANLKEGRGVHDGKRYNFELCKEARQLSQMLDATQEWVALEGKVKEAEYNVEYEKAFLKRAFNDEIELPEEPVTTQPTEIQKKAFQKVAKSFDLLSGIIDKFKSTKPVATKFPNHRVDNLEKQLILQELIMTDPIISRHNPSEVARAYEQILRVAPQIAGEKEIVRAQLREMLAGQSFSAFDADAMTKANMGLMKVRLMLNDTSKGKDK